MPGMFVSDGKTWKPAMVPLTTLKLDSGGHLYDSPVLDEKGHPIMRLDPAAVDAISKDHGVGAKEMPIAPFPEDMQMKALQDNSDNLNRSIAAMAESIKVLADLQKASMKAGK